MPDLKPRIEDRTQVMIRAVFRSESSESEVCVLDISTRGLSASTAQPPKRGEFVELIVGKNSLVGQVKWSGERRFGVAFRERISVIGAISGAEGAITLKEQAQARKSAARPDTSEVSKGRKAEFLIMVAAGAMATFFVADFVGSALHSLDTVELALAGKPVTSSTRAQ